MKNAKIKSVVLVVSLALLMMCAAGATVAWLRTYAAPAANTFVPGEVTCTVIEDPFNGEAKTNVRVQNTGNMSAYLRAAIIVNWADSAGNIYAKAPVRDADYTILLNAGTGGDWFEKGGYYYCRSPVSPARSTAVLISSCSPASPGTAPAGCHLQVTILAEAIQAEGTNGDETPVIQSVWTDVEIGSDGATLEKAGG